MVIMASGIVHCKNGELGKSVVVLRSFEKLRHSYEISTKFESVKAGVNMNLSEILVSLKRG